MKRLILLTLSILAGSILLSSSVTVKAAGGDLDLTFNPGTGANENVQTIALQPDGKIIIGGFFTSYNGTPRNYIARLNPDGSLDTSFNPGTGPSFEVQKLVLQPDGKIIIGGQFSTYNGISRSGIARLNSDGSLDTTFNPGTGTGARGIGAMVLQADGKVIIAGAFTSYNGTPRKDIARINSDGSLDVSFDPGAVTDGFIANVALQGDGKIILEGIFTEYNGVPRQHLARLNQDGSLDASFNPDVFDFSDVRTLVVQPDGKVLLGGFFRISSSPLRQNIIRFNSDGTLDTSFNTGTSTDGIILTIAVQTSGQIIIGGTFSTYDGAFRNYFARLNEDGSLDSTFGVNAGPSGFVAATVLQPDGRIVIGGFFTSYNGVSRNRIARVQSGSSSGFSFNASGYFVQENERVGINVFRSGDLSQAASVDYLTSDAAGLTPCNVVNGIASQRCDYLMAAGTLRFAPGEASKTIIITTIDDSYVETPETFNLTLSNPVGAPLDSAASSATITILDNDNGRAPNPLGDNAFFIHQLYIDFLNREPDPPGFNGWLNILNNCNGSITQPCDRVEVASAFFRSPEFQDRGYFIYRIYRAGLGRIPHYGEFIPDMAKVSGFLDAQELEANKTAFVREFVNRPEFQAKYGALSNSDYVNALSATALVTLPNKQALIDDLQAGRKSRADVFRAVIETSEVYAKYFNEAFIVMEYFGFLRRDPDAAFQGWIDLFNHTNNYRLIINGFINSPEYRQRFGN